MSRNDGPATGRRSRTWILVIGLFLLSPICAEYLIGYDESIGDPMALLAGLIILAPLYGAPAVLIREIARRTKRGWPSILILSAAFGLIQAGLIDQSLFHLEFGPDDPAWANAQGSTVLPLLGIDAGQLINFVGGHIVWTFAAPIAVIESYAGQKAAQPWLSRTGVGVLTVLYVIGATLILSDVETPASVSQLLITGVVVLGLVFVALKLPRRAPSAMQRPTPAPWIVGLGALLLLATSQLVPTDWGWWGVTCIVASLAVLGALLIFWSRRTGWDRRHVLAVAGGALLARATLAFAVEPLGEVVYAMKYAVNATILALTLMLIFGAVQRLQRSTTGER